jgi:hypothetical protein
MPYHDVKPGDCMSSIAEEYGFFWQTLWNLPENASLKAQRGNPNVLMPGEDVVFVPEKREKIESRSTGDIHRFRVKNVPAKLRIQFLADGKPRANVPYTLTIDGKVVSRPGDRTDGNGLVVCSISPLAEAGMLVLGEGKDCIEYALHLGQLNPASEVTGAQQRLRNLGYYDGPLDGVLNEATQDAIRAFQARSGLKPTGALDQATQSKLRSVHDGA